MKRYIKAGFENWKTDYEVHWVSPDGRDCLLAGSNDYEDANRMAREQAREIFESPFETNERKFLFLKEMYMSYGSAVIDFDIETEEYIDNLMSEIDSRMKK